MRIRLRKSKSLRTVQEIVEEAIEAHNTGNINTAQDIYDQLLCQLEKPDPNVFFGYGTILIQRQLYGLGILLLKMGLQLYPNHPLAWTNIGTAYKHISRDDLAVKAYEKAYALNPDSPEVLASMGGFYINRNEALKAEELSRKALAKDPSCHAARMNLGVALLEQGRFEEAWPLYDSRWESLDRAGDKRPYKAPRWTGEKVELLSIHGEQGLGDEIMYMGGFHAAAKRCDKVIVECAGRLIKTFESSFGVKCYPDHKALIDEEGEPDAYIPMGSLFGVVGLPSGDAYMKRPSVVKTGKPIIGVAWKGGTMKTNHKDRSLELGDLCKVFKSVDANFVSVQYGGTDIDREAEKYGLITGPRDFDSLQFRIGTCDLVISVLQTAVHQAGAMGVPCWALTPHRHSWPFAGTDKTMRFYKSVRLFRQAFDEKWESVIDRVCFELPYLEAAA